MSGPSIDHGGAISVDPETLRDVGRRIDDVAVMCARASRAVEEAQRVILDVPDLSAHIDAASLGGVRDRLSRLQERCIDAAVGTQLMADAFEYVELQSTAELLALTDPDAAQRLEWRMARLASADDRIPQMATMLVEEWERHRIEGLDRQQTYLGLLAPLFSIAVAAGRDLPFGVIPPGIPLGGRADAVSVAPVRTSSPASPPTGLASALTRLSTSGGAQVAVEKYTFADGAARFVTYVKGTHNAVPWQSGGTEPWDLESNLELYSGEESASYGATLEALEMAGAQPGDLVDVVGYSQGGMIAARLAMESGFEVQVVVTAGSPVQPTLDSDQTLAALVHTDDLVTALAGGGSPGGTGSADSFRVTAERGAFADALNPLEPHLLDSYVQLAQQADASGDPRVESLDAHWAALGEAQAIERTEYRAQRER